MSKIWPNEAWIFKGVFLPILAWVLLNAGRAGAAGFCANSAPPHCHNRLRRVRSNGALHDSSNQTCAGWCWFVLGGGWRVEAASNKAK
jgi:hypothetical protein